MVKISLEILSKGQDRSMSEVGLFKGRIKCKGGKAPCDGWMDEKGKGQRRGKEQLHLSWEGYQWWSHQWK